MARRPCLLPPPPVSTWLYARLARADIALFRFLLEGYDNLGYMTVVDPWSAVLRVVFSPHQEALMRMTLADMRRTVSFVLLERPSLMSFHLSDARCSDGASVCV